RLHAAGMYAIVDLHWNAQGTLPADGKTGQGRKMADLDHAPAFWSSVASFFKNDHGVVFDLFNEPHDIGWDCWLNGCTTSDGTGTWHTWPDCADPVLITKYGGTPTDYGIRLRDHLRGLAGFKPVASRASSGRGPAGAVTATRPPAAAPTSPRHPAASAAAIAHRRAGGAVPLPTPASILATSPARAALIGLGSILLVAAPLGLAAGLWLLRRRRRPLSAGADVPVSAEAAEHSRT